MACADRNSKCPACGRHLTCWWSCDAETPGACQDCSADVCSACAAEFYVDGEYGPEGSRTTVTATCAECAA